MMTEMLIIFHQLKLVSDYTEVCPHTSDKTNCQWIFLPVLMSQWKCFSGTVDAQQTQLVSLFSPQYVVSGVFCICHAHKHPSTVPLYYQLLHGAAPAWTAYVPPRGATAACSGSSSAAGCFHCCSAEGHKRQTMTTEGKRKAITLQTKRVQKYLVIQEQVRRRISH